MPLFATVVPGVQVNNNTLIDAALLNLIAQPSVSVVGSVDGGSITLGAGSIGTSSIIDANITLPKIELATANSVIGRGTGGISNAFLAASSGIYTDASSIYWKPNIVQIQVAPTAAATISTLRTSPTVLTSFNCPITTTRTSNVLIRCVITMVTDNPTGLSFILKRNGTEIGSAANNLNYTNATYGIASAPLGTSQIKIHYLDAPGSIATHTYSLSIYTYTLASGAQYCIGKNRLDSTGSGISLGMSSIILQEMPT